MCADSAGWGWDPNPALSFNIPAETKCANPSCACVLTLVFCKHHVCVWNSTKASCMLGHASASLLVSLKYSRLHEPSCTPAESFVVVHTLAVRSDPVLNKSQSSLCGSVLSVHLRIA